MKRSKCLLFSALLGSAYLAYIISYIYDGISTENAFEALGAGIATAMLMPHLICVAIATIFNWIGFVGNIRWAALVGGIMYSVGAMLWLVYAPFVVPSLILSFVGFSKLKDLPAGGGNKLAYARKCVYCGALRERGEVFNRYGFCEDCKDEISANVRRQLAQLQQACTELNPNLIAQDQYKVALSEIDKYLNMIFQLEQLRPRVPMFKSSTLEYENTLLSYRATFCEKLGIENTPPTLPTRNSPTDKKPEPINLTSLSESSKKSTKSTVWIVALCILLAFSLYGYGNALSQLEDLTIQLESANTIIQGQSGQIDKLQQMISEFQTEETSAQHTYRLTSGYYTAGKDFIAGTYDIEAVKGHGNVSSDNLFTGGINAIMGVKSEGGLYEKKYSNIKLPEDTELHIDGVTVKLTLIE